MSGIDQVRAPSKPGLFFALAFLLSWIFWIPAAVLSHTDPATPLGLLSFLGGFGPSISGLILIWSEGGRAGIRDLWQRLVGFRRIGWRWYGLIFLVFPTLSALSVLVELLLGKGCPFFPLLAAIWAEPWLILFLPIIALQVVLIGPLSEELGWRGYGLDALQARYSSLGSSLLLGLLWSLWHFPLFFVQDPGNFYYQWGFGTQLFWVFIARMTLISILMTWVYNNNHRSVLSAVLIHFAYNFTFSFVSPIPESMHLSGTALLLVLVLIVLWVWGPRTMTRLPGRQPADP